MEKQSLLHENGSDIEHGVELHGDEVFTDDYSNVTIQQKRRRIPPEPQTAVGPLKSILQSQDFKAILEGGQLLIGEAVQTYAHGHAFIKGAILFDPSKPPAIPEGGQLLIGEAVQTDAHGNAFIKGAILFDPSKPPDMYTKNERIQTGISLMNTSTETMLNQTNTCRACAVKVVNHTRWTLYSHTMYIQGGHSVTAQCDVEPLTFEAFVAEKNKGTATGSYGTASYSVPEKAKDLNITIMWSVPFDRNIYKNWLGIEISDKIEKGDFYRMYYGRSDVTPSDLKQFSGSIGLTKVEVHAKGLYITGTMSSGPKPEALINVHEDEPVENS